MVKRPTLLHGIGDATLRTNASTWALLRRKPRTQELSFAGDIVLEEPQKGKLRSDG